MDYHGISRIYVTQIIFRLLSDRKANYECN